MSLCLGCMEEKDDFLVVCPHCGYAEGTPPKESYHMKPGSVLHGKYIIGRVLGYGGFGITYIAWDYALGRKVAIKEFLPGDFATRMPGETVVTVYNGEATMQFEAGLERFMEEAQRLAKFNSMGSIVDIYDTFIENSTGYIVMQCLEGETVKELIQKNGVMPYESARLIIIEVLKTLAEVHKEGIIHRDISPDNIFITKDNQIKLLDFGAARYASGFHSKSLSVILKPGYAPEEQYRSHGNQGPWSDVYATSATLYKMITGITIEEAMERTVVDNVKSPLELGVDLPEGANTAIMNALNIHAELRTQSADDFIRELASEQVERIIDKPKKSDSGKLPLWLKIVIPSVVGVAILLVTLVAVGVIEIPSFITAGLQANVDDRVPSVINQMLESGQKILAKEKFGMQIIGQDYDEFAQKDIIKTQSPAGGKTIEECYFDNVANKYMVYVVVSGGPSPKVVPLVVGLSLEQATAQLKDLGFLVETEEEYSQDIPAGVVISQDIVDVEYAYGSTLHLIVSKGEMKVDITKTHKIPDLVGLNYDEAYKKLTAIGMYVVKQDQPSTEPENEVISQSVLEGVECREGTTITLVVSNNTVIIPNVQYLPKDEATGLLKTAGIGVSIKEVESTTVAPGLVISQSKVGKATAGVTVTLTVSKGEASKGAEDASKTIEEQKVKVPNVTGATVSSATGTLQGAGLKVKTNYRDVTDKSQDGRVLGVSPASGLSVSPGSTVTITVGRYSTKQVTIPNVAGRTYSAARSTIQNAGLYATQQFETVSEKGKDGVVLRTLPAAGQPMVEGATVTLVVGRYVEQKVTVPNVGAQTLSSAKGQLQTLGLHVSVTYETVSEQNLNGIVLRTSPGAKQSVTPGSTVTVVVGQYAAQKVKVPNVAGKTAGDARYLLESEGFTVKVGERDVKDAAQNGIVLASTPSSGQSLEPGSTVTILVGKSKMAIVPDVVGKTYESGSSALEKAGFKVEKTYENVSDESLNGQILSTNPGGGLTVQAGSTITVVVGSWKAPKMVQVPNVIGSYTHVASRRIAQAGLKAHCTITRDVESNVVHNTNPPPYEWVEEGTTVELILP